MVGDDAVAPLPDRGLRWLCGFTSYLASPPALTEATADVQDALAELQSIGSGGEAQVGLGTGHLVLGRRGRRAPRAGRGAGAVLVPRDNTILPRHPTSAIDVPVYLSPVASGGRSWFDHDPSSWSQVYPLAAAPPGIAIT